MDNVVEHKRLLENQLKLINERLDRAKAVVARETKPAVPEVEETQKRVKRPQQQLLRPTPIKLDGTLSKARLKNVMRTVDSHLASLARPNTICDDKGWYIATRSCRHQLYDRSHANPLVSVKVRTR